MKLAVTSLSIFILFIISSSIYAQNSYWEERVLEPLLGNHNPDGSRQNNSRHDEAIRKIELHQKQIIDMRLQGMTHKEIRNILTQNISRFGDGSISGTVYQDDAVTPIKNDFVIIDAYNEFGDYINSATCDTNGQYTIILFPANYYVKCSSDIYKDEFYNNAVTWRNATIVAVGNAQDIKNIDFILQKYSGSISGYVKNKNSSPLKNVVVHASNDENYSITLTDSAGYFLLEYLPSGDYIVQTMYNGDENYESLIYNDVTSISSATPVHVTEPMTTENINFFLGNAGAVSGQIFKPSGQPFNSPVVVQITRVDGYGGGQAYADTSGKYLIKGLHSGNYKVYLAGYLVDNYIKTWYGGYSSRDASVVTITTPDTLKDINFNLIYGGSISGSFTDKNGIPVTSVSTALYNESGEYEYMPVLRDSNSFKYFRLPPGKYKIQARPYNHIEQWYNNKPSPEEADFIQVPLSDSVKNINFVLQTGGSISGQVLFYSMPVMSGYITVYDLDNKIVKESSFNNGNYSIPGLKPGMYKIHFIDMNEQYAAQWYDNKMTFETAALVHVSQDSTTIINFNVTQNGTLQGYVSDNNLVRLDGSERYVDVFLYDSAGTGCLDISTLTFSGGYKFRSAFGPCKLSAATYNFFPQAQDSLAATYYGGGNTINDPVTQTINLSGEQVLDDLIMEKAPGSISGIIYNNDLPMQEGLYEILAYDEFGYVSKISMYSSTDAEINGSYKITGLRPGPCYLIAGARLMTNDSEAYLQWYQGLPQDIEDLEPRMNIPAGAAAVTVRSEETRGIDFYFNMSGVQENIQSMSFTLEQNYPNPFNPSTTIRYSVPQLSHVTLKIYNTLGEEVKTLLNNDEKPAGTYTLKWNVYNLPSGIYFYQLRAGDFVQAKKMVLMK